MDFCNVCGRYLRAAGAPVVPVEVHLNGNCNPAEHKNTFGCGRVSLLPTYCHLWTAGSVGSDECRDLLTCAETVRILLSPLLFGTVGEVDF